MKHTASARKNTKSNASSPDRRSNGAQFVVCVRNEDYPASLELRKLYQFIPDEAAARRRQVRVVDESGEDYLYPKDYFIPLHLPQAIGRAVLRAH